MVFHNQGASSKMKQNCVEKQTVERRNTKKSRKRHAQAFPNGVPSPLPPALDPFTCSRKYTKLKKEQPAKKETAKNKPELRTRSKMSAGHQEHRKRKKQTSRYQHQNRKKEMNNTSNTSNTKELLDLLEKTKEQIAAAKYNFTLMTHNLRETREELQKLCDHKETEETTQPIFLTMSMALGHR